MATQNRELEGPAVHPLLEAADGNNLSALQRLLVVSRDQVVINVQDVNGRTGLIIACTQGYAQIVESLLSAGADASVCDKNQSTCLHYAVEGEFNDIVALLVKKSSVDIFATNGEGRSPVSIALDRRSASIMKTIHRAKMEKVMHPSGNGVATLPRTGDQEQARNSMREYHSKLFVVAVKLLRTSPEIYKDQTFADLQAYLKEILNAATYKSTSNDVTILHSAAFVGSAEELEWLLDFPATSAVINDFDDDEQTPLHYATMEGHLAAVKVLAAQNTVRPNWVDRFDRTALQIALEKNFRYITFHLLSYPDVKAEQDSLFQDKEALVNAANAILVGGALIASVTFASLLQPPLGWVPYVNLDVPPMGTFWVYNGLAFITALVTVICGTRTVVPEYTVYIRDEVKMINKRLKITALLFFISSDLLFVAYCLAGIAALDPHGNQRWLTKSIIIVGAVVYWICMVLFIWFSSKRRATTKPHLRPALGWKDQELLPDAERCLREAFRYIPPLFSPLNYRTQVSSL